MMKYYEKYVNLVVVTVHIYSAPHFFKFPLLIQAGFQAEPQPQLSHSRQNSPARLPYSRLARPIRQQPRQSYHIPHASGSRRCGTRSEASRAYSRQWNIAPSQSADVEIAFPQVNGLHGIDDDTVGANRK